MGGQLPSLQDRSALPKVGLLLLEGRRELPKRLEQPEDKRGYPEPDSG